MQCMQDRCLALFGLVKLTMQLGQVIISNHYTQLVAHYILWTAWLSLIMLLMMHLPHLYQP